MAQVNPWELDPVVADTPAAPLIQRQPPPQTPAQAERDAAAAALAQRELAAPPPVPAGRMTDTQINDLRVRYDALSGFESTINELETLYRENLEGSQGGILGIAGERNPRANLPLAPTGYGSFDAAAGRLIDQIATVYGMTGTELNSMAELRARLGPYLPSSTDNDQTIQDKMVALRGILDRERQNLVAMLREAGAEPPQPSQAAPPASAPEAADETQRRVTAAGSEADLALSRGDVEADPAREQVNLEAQRRLTRMLREGVPDAEIRAYGSSLGINVEDALRFRRTPDWQNWRRQNPNQLYPFRDEGANVPMDSLSGTVAGAAASPVGTALIHSGNAAVAGTLPLIGDALGTGEQVRLGLDATRRENPMSALIGDMSGAGLAYGVGGRVMSRIAPNLLSGRPLTRMTAGDLAYGAVQGTGENYDPLSGALEAAGGSLLGRGVTRGLASTVSPTGGDLANIYARGTRPTVGQRFRESGPVGSVVNFVEEGSQSIPVAGQFVRANRQSARDQWERGAWNMALENIGRPLPDDVNLGPRAMRHAREAFDDAYDGVRSRLSFTADADWATDLATARADAALLTPGVRQRFNRITADLEQRITQAGGTLNGNRFKAAASELNTEIRRLRNLSSPTQAQRELLSTLEELDSAFHQGARRTSPPDVVDELDRVDRGYAMLTRIEEAARRRPTQIGRFTPSDVLQIEARHGGVRGRRFSAGEGLFTDYASSGRSLEDVLPTSGTSERAALMTGLATLAAPAVGAGGAYALGVDPATIAGASALPFVFNSPGIRSVMAPRRGSSIADLIRRRRLEAAGLGAALGAYGIQRD